MYIKYMLQELLLDRSLELPTFAKPETVIR